MSTEEVVKKRQNLINVVGERPLVHMLFPKAHISLYSRLREMEESLIQVFLPKLMHLHQLRSLLLLSLIWKGPACKITYSIVGTHNKVFSLFSFLLLILDQNWVLLGDETHMANLLSPTQVLRRAAWRASAAAATVTPYSGAPRKHNLWLGLVV